MMEENIAQKLSEIYARDLVPTIQHAINNLIQKYRNKIKQIPYNLSEKDILLIAYGDHVQNEGEAPLKTLNDFSNRYLKGHINTIHILPFYPFSSDDGFSVIDYYAVNTSLGTWEDIENLSRDYRLMFDAVVNHISAKSEWFKGFLANDGKYENYFVEMSPETDLSAVVRPRALPLLSEFEDADGNKKYIWTTFSKDQIDLNFENPKVLLQVIDILLFYISQGAKLIRLDAIGFLWKVPGTTSIHLPQTHAIIQLIRLVIEEITHEITLITETNVPHKENISYFGDGNNEAQMVYNFTLPPLLAYTILKENVVDLQQWANALKLPSNQVCFFNFTASHDGVGVRPVQGILPQKEIDFLAATAEKHGGYVSYKNNSDGSQAPYELNCNYMDLLTSPKEAEEIRIKKMLLAQGVAMAMPGVPGIYFHSLVGSGNDKDGVERTGMKRSINREKLNFLSLISALDDPSSFRGKYFNAYIDLIDIRINQKAFNPFGKYAFPFVNNHVFAIEREHENEKILCLFNISSSTQKLNLFIGEGLELVSGKRENMANVTIEAWQQKWIVLDS